MPPVGFEPTNSAGEWPHTYFLDCAATGIGIYMYIYVYIRYIIIIDVLFKIVDISLKSKEYLTKCNGIPIVRDERDRGCRKDWTSMITTI